MRRHARTGITVPLALGLCLIAGSRADAQADRVIRFADRAPTDPTGPSAIGSPGVPGSPGLTVGPLVRSPVASPVGSLPEALATPAGAFGASLVLPGAGQAALGLRRWVVYGAVEVAAWAIRLDAVHDRRSYARGYRDLAWEEARLQASHAREDGPWGYYETMRDYRESGVFDTDPATPGVQPEEDPATYNGAVWMLARGLYLPGGEGGPDSPGYDLALDYYTDGAAGPGFLWSWEGKDGALERFRALIDDADGAARVATGALGAVLANHLVSAVDALIAARIQADRTVRLESRTDAADPLRWSVGLHISLKD